jgi:hypothetical protein
MGCANASKFPTTVAKSIMYEFAIVSPRPPLELSMQSPKAFVLAAHGTKMLGFTKSIKEAGGQTVGSMQMPIAMNKVAHPRHALRSIQA